MIRVVVVDDQEVVRAGFGALLATQADFDVVGTAENGAEAVRLCAAEHPDVVLMDVRMPVMDGIEATRRITEAVADGGPRILMLTTFDLDEYVYDALSAGASGFLLKDVTAERLFDAVRVVAAGEALLDPAVTRRLIGEFARLRPSAPPPPSRWPSSHRVRSRCSPWWPRALEHRDRRAARRRRPDGEDPREPGARQARPSRPHPGGDHGVRVRPRRAPVGGTTREPAPLRRSSGS